MGLLAFARCLKQDPIASLPETPESTAFEFKEFTEACRLRFPGTRTLASSKICANFAGNRG